MLPSLSTDTAVILRKTYPPVPLCLPRYRTASRPAPAARRQTPLPSPANLPTTTKLPTPTNL